MASALLICSFQLLCLCVLFVCLHSAKKCVWTLWLGDICLFLLLCYTLSLPPPPNKIVNNLSTMNISTLCCLSALLLAVASCLLQSAQGLRLRSRVICFNFFLRVTESDFVWKVSHEFPRVSFLSDQPTPSSSSSSFSTTDKTRERSLQAASRCQGDHDEGHQDELQVREGHWWVSLSWMGKLPFDRVYYSLDLIISNANWHSLSLFFLPFFLPFILMTTQTNKST